jgi:2',3'-cyclic-nucleotide 2'-phosphodiesterase (5'-nucleotidase family)
MSHLGYKYRDEPNKLCDLKLAEMTQDIDLIIGGHTHTSSINQVKKSSWQRSISKPSRLLRY